MSHNSSTNGATKARLYRKAARLISEERSSYSCMAIYAAKGGEVWPEEANQYAKLFSPSESTSPDTALQWGIYAACREFLGGVKDDDWCREFRVLLLCMAAAVAENP